MSWILGALLMGGSVYINGVKANSLRNFEIEDVDIKIDAYGNVYITAPNLIVEVAGTSAPPAETTPQSDSAVPVAQGSGVRGTGAAEPLAPEPVRPFLEAEPPASDLAVPSATVQVAATAVAPSAVLAAPPENAVPPERWWLVIEDNASKGHVLEISVNGTPVSIYQSGSAPVMIDLAPFLHPGENQVDVLAQDSDALGGGVLHVYVAPGANQNGELVLEEPVLVFSRRASDDPAGAMFHRTLSIP
ncbi:MAG: hypothetical protein ACI9VR_002313 [Cognaticolwellia sp.]|jgi:hypothetical protein